MRRSSRRVPQLIAERQGVALLAALLLMAVLGVMGATVLMATSTEITISGNYRRGIEVFYLAEAGAEEARARLRGSSLNNQDFIGDYVKGYNPQWSAYVLTSTDWTPSDDETYSTQLTNYIPTRTTQTNTSVLTNSIQDDLSYWVKIRHKTEYDAERAGHRTGSPHYIDRDGSQKKHTKANPGHVVFYGYPALDSIEPTEFTTAEATEAFPAELVTAYGSLKGGSSVIEIEVVHHPGPRALAAVYARNGVSLSGSSNTISGIDQCRAVSPRAPVYTVTPSVTMGKAAFQGNPSGPEQGPLDLDLPFVIGSLKKGAQPLTIDQISVALASAADPRTYYAYAASSPMPGVFTIHNSIGFGILLIEGNAMIRGPMIWQGLIISSGTLTLDGSTGQIQIRGGVWSHHVHHVAGSIDIAYDSCAIKTSLLNRPLTVTRWRQVL